MSATELRTIRGVSVQYTWEWSDPLTLEKWRDFRISLYSFNRADGRPVRDIYGDMYPGFSRFCTVSADLCTAARSVPTKINPLTGLSYRLVLFDICVFFWRNFFFGISFLGRKWREEAEPCSAHTVEGLHRLTLVCEYKTRREVGVNGTCGSFSAPLVSYKLNL